MSLAMPPRPLGYPPTPASRRGPASSTTPRQAVMRPTAAAQVAPELEPEQGLLWSTIKRQLYKSEVSHMKRLVGEGLINENRLLRDELSSLRQILRDFQRQNDERSDSLKHQVMICGSQHRSLLKRQATIILEDLRVQAQSYGHTLEDLVPELRDARLSAFLGEGSGQPLRSACPGLPRKGYSPPVTPSTRPSSSSGCSSTRHSLASPELFGATALPLGRQLGVDELGVVAEGIREALEDEHAALLSAIGEQLANLEAEEARRVETVGQASRGEPSTAELQRFLHRLQDLAVSPALRTLALTSPGPGTGLEPGAAVTPVPGGASVKRLQALIAERRQSAPRESAGLGAVPEAVRAAPAVLGGEGGGGAGGGKTPASGGRPIDPFFDDPFA